MPTWPVPLALVALSLIPVIAGAVRLTDLSTGSTHMPQDAHHPEMPVALIVHIVSATAYSVLGAFQFSAGLRRRHARWHRTAGRVLVPLGLAVALSALWLTLVYPTEVNTGPLLYWSRVIFAVAMATCLVLGLMTVRARNFRAHRAWMIRAYALGLGAGTQVVTIGLAEATLGTSAAVADAATAAGWAVNLAVAESIIRRPRARGRRSIHPSKEKLR
ncbi:DUF2306 domain-containing protein [Nocardioides sp.]|uniref:DUF2306 domain-containing protein n=1 Tax=Nocardioides sp. TaxID=35761 RepID=UPI00262234CD|nr:DUF2306 domain-containing protein [Nocardioides sp.]